MDPRTLPHALEEASKQLLCRDWRAPRGRKVHFREVRGLRVEGDPPPEQPALPVAHERLLDGGVGRPDNAGLPLLAKYAARREAEDAMMGARFQGDGFRPIGENSNEEKDL